MRGHLVQPPVVRVWSGRDLPFRGPPRPLVSGRPLVGAIAGNESRGPHIGLQPPHLLKIETPPQPLDSALGVHYPLLARVERMALAANLNPQGGLGGPSMKHVATGAGHHGVIELGMDIGFHAVGLSTRLY